MEEEHFNAEEQFDGDEQCYVAEQFDLEVSLMWRSSVTLWGSLMWRRSVMLRSKLSRLSNSHAFHTLTIFFTTTSSYTLMSNAHEPELKCHTVTIFFNHSIKLSRKKYYERV